MEGKARFIFPVLMSGFMVFIVTALVTLLNMGLRADYVVRWMRAFVVAWPVAALVAFLAMPVARRLTLRIIALIERPG